MSDLDKMKEIAEQMPESPEKQQALQAYSNLKTFEIIADSFDRFINHNLKGAYREKERQENGKVTTNN